METTVGKHAMGVKAPGKTMGVMKPCTGIGDMMQLTGVVTVGMDDGETKVLILGGGVSAVGGVGTLSSTLHRGVHLVQHLPLLHQ